MKSWQACCITARAYIDSSTHEAHTVAEIAATCKMAKFLVSHYMFCSTAIKTLYPLLLSDLCIRTSADQGFFSVPENFCCCAAFVCCIAAQQFCERQPACMVTGHFGPWTLWTQDISALSLVGSNCPDNLALVPKCHKDRLDPSAQLSSPKCQSVSGFMPHFLQIIDSERCLSKTCAYRTTGYFLSQLEGLFITEKCNAK